MLKLSPPYFQILKYTACGIAILALAAALCCCGYDSPGAECEPQYIDSECGPPTGRVYAEHFWFVQISDLHQSRDNGSSVFDYGLTPKGDYQGLREQLEYINQVLRPAFVVATGDLVDGGVLEQLPCQWRDYRRGVLDACYDDRQYHDLPGNHDAYFDFELDHFLRYSISKETHHWWTVKTDDGCHGFVALCSVDPGYNRGRIDERELAWIESALDALAPCGMVLLFAHHNTDQDQIASLLGPQGLLAERGVTAFAAGHVHNDGQWHNAGVLYLHTDAMYVNRPAGCRGRMRLFSIDRGNLSSAPKAILDCGPQVLITSPQDAADANPSNPLGHVIGAELEVRALGLFDQPLELTLSIDSNEPLELEPIGGSLYSARVDCSALAEGRHTLEVRAAGFDDCDNARHSIEVLR
ncbi:MAG: metallophosphoesterase [Candidatus Alcyoniella australis]|nr:metallophosphoesterase [Candidatus Alcyoniella australis]